MQYELLMDYMDMWKRYMKHDNHKLGFPSRSIGMNNSSSTSFDDMIEEADNKIVRIISAVVDSLDNEQRKAIWARWLGTKKPMYYELKLQLAIDNLLTIVGRRLDL